MSQNSCMTITDIIAWTEVNHHQSPMLLLYKMAENLVIDVHFKAYHFEKTAEKGETTDVNANAAQSIVRLALKGRQQMLGIYTP